MSRQQFSTEALGYNREEVDRYIDNLEKEINLINDKLELKQKRENNTGKEYLSIEVSENSISIDKDKEREIETDKTKIIYEKFKEETDTKFYIKKVRENLLKIKK